MLQTDPLFQNEEVLQLLLYLCEQGELTDSSYKNIIKLIQIPEIMHMFVECLGLKILLDVSKCNIKLRDLIEQLTQKQGQLKVNDIERFFTSLNLTPKNDNKFKENTIIKYFVNYIMFIQEQSPVLSVILKQLQKLNSKTLNIIYKLYNNLNNQQEYIYTLIQLYSSFTVQINIDKQPYQISNHGNFIHEDFTCIFSSQQEGLTYVSQNKNYILNLPEAEQQIFKHVQIICLEKFRQIQQHDIQCYVILKYFSEENQVIENRNTASTFLYVLFSQFNKQKCKQIYRKYEKYLLIMVQQLLQNMHTFNSGIYFLKLFQKIVKQQNEPLQFQSRYSHTPRCIILIIEEKQQQGINNFLNIFQNNLILKYESIIDCNNLNYEMVPLVINSQFATNLNMCLKMFHLDEIVFVVHGFIISYSIFIKTCIELSVDLTKIRLLWEYREKHHPFYQSFFKFKQLQYSVMNRGVSDGGFTDEYFEQISNQVNNNNNKRIQIPYFTILNQVLLFSKPCSQNLYQIRLQKKNGEILQYPMLYACSCTQSCRFTAMINAGESQTLQIYGDNEKIKHFFIKIRTKYLALTITPENSDDIEWVTDSLTIQFRSDVCIVCDDVKFTNIVQMSIIFYTQIQCIDTEYLF